MVIKVTPNVFIQVSYDTFIKTKAPDVLGACPALLGQDRFDPLVCSVHRGVDGRQCRIGAIGQDSCDDGDEDHD